MFFSIEAYDVLLLYLQSLLSLNGPFNHSMVLFVFPLLLKKIPKFFHILNFGYIASIQVLTLQISTFLNGEIYLCLLVNWVSQVL